MNKIYNSKLFTILKFYNADFTRKKMKLIVGIE